MLNPKGPPSRVRDRQHHRSQGSLWIEAEATGVAQSRAAVVGVGNVLRTAKIEGELDLDPRLCLHLPPPTWSSLLFGSG